MGRRGHDACRFVSPGAHQWRRRLAQGIMKAVFEEEERRPGRVLDHEFIRDYTSGFAQLAAAIKNASWDQIIEQSGIRGRKLRLLPNLY